MWASELEHIVTCCFSQVGIEDKAIGKMLVKYPWILSTSIQDNYEEIISFFNVQKVWYH